MSSAILTASMLRDINDTMRGISVALILVALVGEARADPAEEAVRLVDQGIALYKAKDYAAARTAFARARDLVPDKANPYRWLGVTDAALGRCGEAVTELDTFLSRVPAGDPRTIEAITIRDRCQAELAPRVGHLVVESVPTEAEVRLDDESSPPLGKTPLQRDVSAGNHVVFLRKAGLEPVAKPVQVIRGETVHLEVTLSAHQEARIGTLVVQSAPDGAEVVLDDANSAPVGKTPYRNDALSTGSHLVIVRAPGYETVSRAVTIGPRETMRLDLTLEPTGVTRSLSKTGELVLQSTPPGAVVRLDSDKGPALGNTPLRREVPIGAHVAYLSTPGYKPQSKGVSVGPGEQVRVDLTLEKRSYTWIAGVAIPGGVVLGIALYLIVSAGTQTHATVLPSVGALQ
jgi:hypothetical protein